jgi:L-alanine-DL-glutamate epimerase-like enolase superfamily enzyme
VIKPLLLDGEWQSPVSAFETLSRKLHVLAIQCGEEGPLAQIIAGTDVALWDLVGRRLNVPLWQLFGGTSDDVSVYASGINPVEPQTIAARKHREGYRAFKLKIGFGVERDMANLQTLRDALGWDIALMVDVNQAWDVDTAIESARQSRNSSSIGLRNHCRPIAHRRNGCAWHPRARSRSPLERTCAALMISRARLRLAR